MAVGNGCVNDQLLFNTVIQYTYYHGLTDETWAEPSSIFEIRNPIDASLPEPMIVLYSIHKVANNQSLKTEFTDQWRDFSRIYMNAVEKCCQDTSATDCDFYSHAFNETDPCYAEVMIFSFIIFYHVCALAWHLSDTFEQTINVTSLMEIVSKLHWARYHISGANPRIGQLLLRPRSVLPLLHLLPQRSTRGKRSNINLVEHFPIPFILI